MQVCFIQGTPSPLQLLQRLNKRGTFGLHSNRALFVRYRSFGRRSSCCRLLITGQLTLLNEKTRPTVRRNQQHTGKKGKTVKNFVCTTKTVAESDSAAVETDVEDSFFFKNDISEVSQEDDKDIDSVVRDLSEQDVRRAALILERNFADKEKTNLSKQDNFEDVSLTSATQYNLDETNVSLCSEIKDAMKEFEGVSALPQTAFEQEKYAKRIRSSESLRYVEEMKLAHNVKLLKAVENTFRRFPEQTGKEATIENVAEYLQTSVSDLKMILRGGRASQQILVSLHMGLIRMIAREVLRSRFSGDTKTNFMDMVQEGALGLLRATEKYNGKLGWKFSTYAAWWIRATMVRALEEHCRSVHVPAGVLEAYQAAKRNQAVLKKELGREPNEKEVADSLGISTKKLKHCIQSVNNRPLSLDSFTPNSDSSKGTGSSRIYSASTGSDDTMDNIFEDMLRSDLRELIAEKLKPRESEALRLRFGLDDGNPRTLEECGRIMAVSCERARKIVLSGLEKLRHPSVIQKLEVYV